MAGGRRDRLLYRRQCLGTAPRRGSPAPHGGSTTSRWLRVRAPRRRSWRGAPSTRTCTPPSFMPVLGGGLILASFSTSPWFELLLLGVSVPAVFSIRYAPRFLAEARLAEQRSQLERRAEEVLAQEQLAPRRWAARLAPETLPVYEGFDIGPRLRGWYRDDGGRFLRRLPYRAATSGRGDRRHGRPRDRTLDNRFPGQAHPADFPAPVPRPGPGPRGTQQDAFDFRSARRHGLGVHA